jgi:hypothetical protein
VIHIALLPEFLSFGLQHWLEEEEMQRYLQAFVVGYRGLSMNLLEKKR